MRTDEWLDDIHRRLIKRDPTAPVELAEQLFEPLKGKLSADNPDITDPSLISDACGDALLNYVRHPDTYDPSKRGLFGYLLMSARGDLVNALDSLKRKKNRENTVILVEPDAIPRNQLSELAENMERDEVERQLAEILPDERDQQAALMMMDGEKSTERFADVFGCQNAGKDEMKRIVKRHKDRIDKMLKRKLGGNDE